MALGFVLKQNLMQQKYFSFLLKDVHIRQRFVSTVSEFQTGEKPGEALTASDHGQERVLCFDDPCLVYKHKTTWDLFRALFVLKLCGYDVIVNNSSQLMKTGSRVLGARLFSLLMRPSVYSQFVGGSSQGEIRACSTKLRAAGIGTLLALPNEDDIGLSDDTDTVCDRNLQATLNCLNMAAEVQTANPMMQLKITALLRANLCAKLSDLHPQPSKNPQLVEEVAQAMKTGKPIWIKGLSQGEQNAFNRGLMRLRSVGELAVDKGVIVMVDAEYTYINPALNLLTLAMMLNYNLRDSIVFYTYQNYLKATGEVLRNDLNFLDASHVCFGAKLVRGAYMTKERHLAATQGYPDPVQDTFEDTSKMYHENMELLLSRVGKNPRRNKVMIASHNYETIEFAINRIKAHDIDLHSGSVFLGQVYGISDHIAFLLGSRGYPIYKSIPYGSLAETLPYLSRRAQENKAIFTGARQEKTMLVTAIKGRLLGVSGTT